MDLPLPTLRGVVILSFPSESLSHRVGAFTPSELLSDVAPWASPLGFCEPQGCSPVTLKLWSALSLPQG